MKYVGYIIVAVVFYFIGLQSVDTVAIQKSAHSNGYDVGYADMNLKAYKCVLQNYTKDEISGCVQGAR